MTEHAQTPLDLAHAAMQVGGDAERMAFYRLLANSELILWLEEEAAQEAAMPKVTHFEEGAFVLGFDLEERLAEVTGAPVPTLKLPGRALAGMLQGQGVGLALNLGDAPSAMLIPPAAITWLVETLRGAGAAAGMAERQVASFAEIGPMAQALTAALGDALSGIANVTGAYLVRAEYVDGSAGPLLIVTGPRDAGRIANAVGEAVVFSGIDDMALDVSVLPDEAAVPARVRELGLALRIERVAAETVQVVNPAAPGMDPARPPRLR